MNVHWHFISALQTDLSHKEWSLILKKRECWKCSHSTENTKTIKMKNNSFFQYEEPATVRPYWNPILVFKKYQHIWFPNKTFVNNETYLWEKEYGNSSAYSGVSDVQNSQLCSSQLFTFSIYDKSIKNANLFAPTFSAKIDKNWVGFFHFGISNLGTCVYEFLRTHFFPLEPCPVSLLNKILMTEFKQTFLLHENFTKMHSFSDILESSHFLDKWS